MSAHIPTRAATDAYNTRVPTKQATKRAKTAGPGSQWDCPTSQISLPYPGSVRSTLSSDSDFISYKVSALDSLAPRPTLRYRPSTRVNAIPERSGSRTQQFEDRDVILEDIADPRKRIDDLADDLDAKDLRELMERDKRRRERKQLQEQERMERKLARRAEKHRQAEAEAKQTGTPPPENLERGVMGRELVGLGLEPTSTVVTSSKRRDSPMDLDAATADTDTGHVIKPLDDFHPAIVLPEDEPEQSEQLERLEQPKQLEQLDETPQQTSSKPAERDEQVSALPQGSKLAGILRSKKSRSKSTLGSDKDRVITEDENLRKNSESSNKTTNRLSFTSFWKWGGKGHRYSGPSTFSNTSREEMQAAVAGPQSSQAEALSKLQGEDTATGPHYMVHKPAPGVPKRTRSRFREDLPDFPLSPPDSRVQSPETDEPLPSLAEMSPEPVSQPTPPIGMQHGTPSSIERAAGAQSAETHLSMSLASIDSEASWLSGRVGSQRAGGRRDSALRSSRRDATETSDSPSNSTQEELAIADDDYLSRLAPDRPSGGITHHGRRSGEGRPSSDEEESIHASSVKWGTVGARPDVVEYHVHDRETMRSRQGLVNIDSGDEDDVEMVTPSSQ